MVGDIKLIGIYWYIIWKFGRVRALLSLSTLLYSYSTPLYSTILYSIYLAI